MYEVDMSTEEMLELTTEIRGGTEQIKETVNQIEIKLENDKYNLVQKQFVETYLKTLNGAMQLVADAIESCETELKELQI